MHTAAAYRNTFALLPPWRKSRYADLAVRETFSLTPCAVLFLLVFSLIGFNQFINFSGVFFVQPPINHIDRQIDRENRQREKERVIKAMKYSGPEAEYQKHRLQDEDI